MRTLFYVIYYLKISVEFLYAIFYFSLLLHHSADVRFCFALSSAGGGETPVIMGHAICQTTIKPS